ncbi:GntR family transcriptional regulator [Lapillicoccus jejuensis]|uniref:GntR family transcriptional regulator n=1 Tax=Lapillicoccus jejuensis TaxID=402171 RepID=A0A542DZH2_9MICO|nr:GntR family transcriptional regulator [Lapillicoccus jejuensis]
MPSSPRRRPEPEPHPDPPSGLGDLVLRPVPAHAFESCVERLATAIRLGVYPPASMLPPERELAERLGVSRSTLREAIAALRQAGLVRTRRGRQGGTVVSYRPQEPVEASYDALQLSERRAELLDSLLFRRVVEPGAAWAAAGRSLTASERLLLTTSLTEVESAPDPGAHRQADSRLHLAIAGVTGSPRIVAAVTEVQARLHELLLRIPVLEANIAHSDRQHRAVVGAVLRGDPAAARRAMERHCDDTAALLRGLLAS